MRSVNKFLALSLAALFAVSAVFAPSAWAQSGRSGINNPSSVTYPIPPSKGGTGVANNAAATFTRSGNHALTITTTGPTGVTLPTSGTLAATTQGTWTPTITASSGTITTVSSSLEKYTKIDNAVLFSLTITMTNNGTGSGVLQFTIPFNVSGAYGAATCFNTSSAETAAGFTTDTTGNVMGVRLYSGVYPVATGQGLRCVGWFLTA